MRCLSLIASVLLTLPAVAADTVEKADTTANTEQEEQQQPLPTVTIETEQPTLLDDEKPNEIIAGPVTYSGAAIEAFKTESILELINPMAPEQYGYAEDNVVRDPIDNKVSGIKLFSIKF